MAYEDYLATTVPWLPLLDKNTLLFHAAIDAGGPLQTRVLRGKPQHMGCRLNLVRARQGDGD